ncbi:hypothetical protein X727_30980 [Mesorhizobium sp. L103C119B0]|nr:hypothetical protein X727_30980 [Mesorhizobium sp. L103C119B0]
MTAEIRRHVDAVELLQMPADLAHAHPARIHGDDLVVEIGKAPLVFGDQLRIEAPGPVARDRKRHLRRARQNRFLRMAVAAIGSATGAFVLEMLVEFGVQNALRKRLLQVVEQPVLGEHLVGIAAGKQLVQKFLVYSHVMILSFPSSWPQAQNS